MNLLYKDSTSSDIKLAAVCAPREINNQTVPFQYELRVVNGLPSSAATSSESPVAINTGGLIGTPNFNGKRICAYLQGFSTHRGRRVKWAKASQKLRQLLFRSTFSISILIVQIVIVPKRFEA